MAKIESKKEEVLNLKAILFKCIYIFRQNKNSKASFEKLETIQPIVFTQFIGDEYEDVVTKQRQALIVKT